MNAGIAALGLPTVYMVDDEDMVREGLEWLLRSRRLLYEGFASAEAFEAMLDGQSLPWPRAPSCVLLDVRMPVTSGLVLFERLAQRGLLQVLPVIFLTGYADVPTAVDAVRRGAFDFVEKPFVDNALIDLVQRALQASAAALTAPVSDAGVLRLIGTLTEREDRVMRLLVEGHSNRAIAEVLDIGVRRVEEDRAKVFEKMEVRSAVELANKVWGLVQGPAARQAPRGGAPAA